MAREVMVAALDRQREGLGGDRCAAVGGDQAHGEDPAVTRLRRSVEGGGRASGVVEGDAGRQRRREQPLKAVSLTELTLGVPVVVMLNTPAEPARRWCGRRW